MKRSELNQIIRETERFFAENCFFLPAWAHWSAAEWNGKSLECAEIVERGLGWDITDFGSGSFHRTGLVLFTLRNGRLESGHKPYAEKIMVVGEGQETPYHYHWTKIEDIINRGGGILEMELRREREDGGLSDEMVEVSVDGIVRRLQLGERLTLHPGESVTLPTGLYHRFWGHEGRGPVLTGEVSMVNDDAVDNHFLEPVGRFPAVEEDEEPYRLLVSDYERWT